MNYVNVIKKIKTNMVNTHRHIGTYVYLLVVTERSVLSAYDVRDRVRRRIQRD